MSEFDMSVAGDNDQWMLLERVSADDYPLIVRSRLNSAISDFAEANAAIAVICDVLPELVREDGMPTCLNELYELEDSIVACLDDVGENAFHTASATGDGRRVIYFAVDATLDVEHIVSKIVSKVATISVLKTFQFDVYRDFITPTALDRQFDGDRSVISNLGSHGDSGSTPRKIDFWFYGDRSSLKQCVQRLAANDFEVDHWLEDPVGVVLTKVAAADFDAFRQITPLLVETAAECGVTYDGWETLVLRNEPEPAVGIKSTLLSKLFGKKKK